MDKLRRQAKEAFVSPYLREPLRSLEEVMRLRAEGRAGTRATPGKGETAEGARQLREATQEGVGQRA